MRFNIQYSILAGLLILLSGCQRIKEVEPTYNESGTALASEPSYVVASMAPIVVTISSQPRPSWPVIPSPLSSPLPTQVATQVPTQAPTQSATPTKVPTTLTSTVPSEKPTLGVEPTLTQLPTPSEMPTVTMMLTPIGKPSPTPLPTLIPVETPILKPTTPPLVTPIAKPTQPPLVTPTNVPPQDPPVVPTVLPTVFPTNVPSPGYVNLLWTRPLQREDGTTLPESEISVYRLRYFDENGLVAVTEVPGTQTNVQIWAEKPYRYEIATVDTDGLQSDFVGPTTSPTTQATRTP